MSFLFRFNQLNAARSAKGEDDEDEGLMSETRIVGARIRPKSRMEWKEEYKSHIDKQRSEREKQQQQYQQERTKRSDYSVRGGRHKSVSRGSSKRSEYDGGLTSYRR